MAISRAQLAAALVEYDNEEAPPSQRKNHRQSALFTHFQPRSPPAPQLPPPRPESSFRQSPPNQAFRQSRAKSSRLSSGSFESPLEHPDPVPDVSLDRWALPSHLVSNSPPARTISRLGHISTGSVSTPVPPAEYSPAAARAVSIHLDYPDVPPESRPSLSDNRRRTISFDLTDTRRRTQSSSDHIGVDSVLAQAERVRNLADQPRSRSVMGFDGPGLWDLERRVDGPRMIPLPSSPGSMRRSFDWDRAGSAMDVRNVADPMEVEEEVDTPNPFALPAPPPTQASKFDPKFAQSELSLNNPSKSMSARPTSTYTRHRSSSSYSPSRPSFSQPGLDRSDQEDEQEIDGFIPLSRPTYSDIPSPSDFGKPLIPPKYRRLPPTNRSTLLRPKTLIMPQSLTMAELSKIPPRVQGEREGWVLGEKPLPREARSSILTLGGRQVEGKEFGKGLAGELRAMQEVDEERARMEEEEKERRERAKERLPGRLYGTSLMDQLEARKQYTKNRQRVFTGDSRPSMFARPTLSTSISATSSLATQAQPYPPSIHPASPEKTQPRGPLLQFDPNHPDTLAYNPTALSPSGAEQDGTLRPQRGRGRPGMVNSRSVFGVDELWEKEMKKLALIQAEEEERLRIQAEKESAAAEAEALKRKKKGWLGKSKGKGKGKEREEVLEMDEYERVAVEDDGAEEISPEHGGVGVPDLPPMLEYSPEKPPAPIPQEQDQLREPGKDVSVDEDDEELQNRGARREMPEGSDTSDEDDIPLSKIAPNRPYPQSIRDESDSEEDIPLSRIARPPHISTSSSTATTTAPLVLNSDLSGSLGLSVPALPPSISPRPPTIPPSGGPIKLNKDTDSDSEDDDKPLALRVPANSISQLGVPRSLAEKEEIEDDLPLGFKHPTAVQSRQVSGSASMYGVPQQQSGSASMYGMPQQQWGGMPGLPYSTSMYGNGMPGMPMGGYPGQWGYGSPMIPGMPMYGHPPMGMSPSMGNMGIPGMGIPGLPMSGPGGQPGFGPPGPGQGQGPGLGPGQNIDSWRKGVRAPSTVNGETGV